MTKSDHPHSAEFFGEQRDYWWNRDFLALMARRWGLDEVSSLADVGCGVGHWSRLLYPFLRQPARLTGVDREPRWVAKAEENFRRAFPKVTPDAASFCQADATALPLPDESFDAVTCQTVLMHLADPQRALREMIRILRPGGLLICAEPNNLRNLLTMSSLTDNEPVESLVRCYEFWLRQHRGRVAAGEGNHSIGELLPGFFARHGLRDIAVYMGDRPAALFPPYAAAEQKVLIEQERQWHESGKGPWEKEELRRLTLLGGGSGAFFEAAWKESDERYQREQEAIVAGEYHSAGGVLSYLVSARKP